MKKYFSGVQSCAELDMLEAAAVPHILLTPSQLDRLAAPSKTADRFGRRLPTRFMLDNGAYELFKRGKSIDPATF